VYLQEKINLAAPHFVLCDTNEPWENLMQLIEKAATDAYAILCISSSNAHAMASMRRFMIAMMDAGCAAPVIININADETTVDEQLIHMATDAGALLLDGFGDGIWLRSLSDLQHVKVSGRTYLPVHHTDQFLNNTAFSILQATRTRISKTEYISCPSCGRTLFDLQETTAKIRNATNHLKGVKIAIMGCIVNGPGEMADADFGYVGSGPGKITLYRGKEVVKRHIPSETAVDELIELLKDNGVWLDATAAS
jgi:(E)-4-hydroxy-3-methylbut-2-enyl-diphosphate synthase